MAVDYVRLGQLINQHREFRVLINSLRPGRLRPEKKALVEALNPRVTRYLASEPLALEAWAEFMTCINEGFVYSLVPTPRQAIAATLLAGAAIKRSDLELRAGLKASLYQARADFLRREVTVPGASGSGQPVLYRPRTSGASFELPRFAKLLAHYDLLSRRVAPEGKLATAMKGLLSNPERSLAPLGALRTLDHEAIERALANTVSTVPSLRATPAIVSGTRQTTAYAPTAMALRLRQFRCVQQQENAGSDELFWGGNFVRCSNLQEIYEEIERFLAQRTGSPLELKFQWEHKSFMCPQDQGIPYSCHSQGPWIPLNGETVFEQKLFHGFGPWAGVVYCIEDDDAEYEAVAEVIDTVGDYAEVVGRTASVVSGALAAGGVTGPAAVAAGAVATAAEVVNVGTDVVGAVVDIVNFFDSDDMIDSFNLSGPGDYAERDAVHVLKGDQPEETADLKESSDGAHYQLTFAMSYGPPESLHRTWGCEALATKWYAANDGGWITKSGGVFGDSGEVSAGCAFTPPIDWLTADTVVASDSSGHAEVVAGFPTLERYGAYGSVKVHWGISAFRSLRFKYFMQGFRFEKKV